MKKQNNKVLKKTAEQLAVEEMEKIVAAQALEKLIAENAAMQKRAEQDRQQLIEYGIQSAIKEGSTEIRKMKRLVEFIGIKRIPKQLLLQAGAVFNWWSGDAIVDGVRFRRHFMKWHEYYMVSGKDQ